MHSHMILFSSFILSICYFLPTSHTEGIEEKGWLDACDLRRIKAEGLVPEEPPIPTTTTPKASGWTPPSSLYHGSWGIVPFRPLASKDEMVEDIKKKFALDAMERGESVEKGDWSKDARGFMSDFYYDDYN